MAMPAWFQVSAFRVKQPVFQAEVFQKDSQPWDSVIHSLPHVFFSVSSPETYCGLVGDQINQTGEVQN